MEESPSERAKVVMSVRDRTLARRLRSRKQAFIEMTFLLIREWVDLARKEIVE